MSERDLPLKLQTGSLFWQMGGSTLLRVRLSAYEARPQRGRPAISELADLDVLGIEVAPDFRVRYRAAECKSGRVGAKELFWLRGVLDFFGADDGYLVVKNETARKPALRELAERLDLGLLAAAEFPTLTAALRNPPPKLLFDDATIATADRFLSTLNSRLERLVDYCLRLFWQLPMHRNIQLAVSYLEDAKGTLDPNDRGHLLLFGELVYRYCLALFAACERVFKCGAPHVADLLPAYLHGGEHGLREASTRLQAAEELQRRLEGGDRVDLAGAFSPLPPYYNGLLELVTRVLRRPDYATQMLRHLQAGLYSDVVRNTPIHEAEPQPDLIAVKLLNDVITFLVRAAGLDQSFRTNLGLVLTASPGEAEPTSSGGQDRQSRPEHANSPLAPAVTKPSDTAKAANLGGSAQGRLSIETETKG